jgi:uncharacterized membrane protein YdbT with pleckstrin-like domain
MARLEEILNPEERLLFRTRLHWLACAPTALVVSVAGLLVLALSGLFARRPVADLFAAAPAATSILAAGLLLVVLVPLLVVRFLITTHEFGVTDRRVIACMGWMSVRTVDLSVAKVESLVIEQSPAGRLLGYGDVKVVGTGGSAESFRGVRDPIGFRKAVNAAADRGQRSGAGEA